MDSDVMASIYGQIVSGTAKTDSHLVTDEETSKAWDAIAKQVADMRKANPDVHFEIPNEIPGRPGSSVLGDTPPVPAETPAKSEAPAEDEPEEPEEPVEDEPEAEQEDE